MNADNNSFLNGVNLPGLIKMRCGSYTNLASKIGWSKQKLQYKIKNPNSINLSEAKEIAEAMELQLDANLIEFFLQSK